MTGAGIRESLLRTFESLATEAEELRAASAAPDVRRMLALIASTQDARFAFHAAKPHEVPPSDNPVADSAWQHRIEAAAVRIRAGETAIDEWLRRGIPPEDELQRTREGVAFLVAMTFTPTWMRDCDIYVVVGKGSGSFAAELVRRGQRRLIVYLRHDEEVPPEAVVVRSVAELAEAMLGFHGEPPNVPRLRFLPDADIGTDEQRAITTTIGQTLDIASGLANRGDEREASLAQRGFSNLATVASSPSADALGDALRGKPFVVVTSGSSLEQQAHQLSALKGRTFVVASPEALAVQGKAGAFPDAVLVGDQVASLQQLDGAAPARIIVLASATAQQGLLRRAAPRFVFVPGPSPIDDWIVEGLGERRRILGGPSFATAALRLGLTWRCDPIVLIGNGFSDDGRAFSTDLARRWLEAAARELTGKVSFIHCTDGGDGLAGWESVSPAALEKRPLGVTFDPLGLLAGLPTDRAERRTRLEQQVRRLVADLDAFLGECRKALVLLAKAKRNGELFAKARTEVVDLLAAFGRVPVAPRVAQAGTNEAIQKLASQTTVAEWIEAAVDLVSAMERIARTLRVPAAHALDELTRA